MAYRAGIFRRFLSSLPPKASATPPPEPSSSVSSTTLHVSGMHRRTKSEKLLEVFSEFGKVEEAKVVTDKISGFSKGYGFVRYASPEDAERGRKNMNGKFLDGWVIFSEYARLTTPLEQ